MTLYPELYASEILSLNLSVARFLHLHNFALLIIAFLVSYL
jgi:hypothetical protein